MVRLRTILFTIAVLVVAYILLAPTLPFAGTTTIVILKDTSYYTAVPQFQLIGYKMTFVGDTRLVGMSFHFPGNVAGNQAINAYARITQGEIVYQSPVFQIPVDDWKDLSFDITVKAGVPYDFILATPGPGDPTYITITTDVLPPSTSVYSAISTIGQAKIAFKLVGAL